MTIFQALVLGAIQGLTEFFPISSSGHLALVPAILDWQPTPLSFDAALHLATLAALVWVFWSDLKQLAISMVRTPQDPWGHFGWALLIATIPTVLAALLFRSLFETLHEMPLFIAINLGVWGVVLWIADRFPQRGPAIPRLTFRSIWIVGLAQAISLIPGTSRSGITITAGRFLALPRETAARLAFLIGLPATALAGASSLVDLMRDPQGVTPLVFMIGFVSAFVVGLLCIRGLLQLLKSSSFRWFAVYRVVFSILAFVLLTS